MKMPQTSSKSLRDFLSGTPAGCFLGTANASVPMDALVGGTSLDVAPDALAGRSVLLATPDQLTTALALIELDGVARRLVLCPPDLPSEQLASVITTAQVDALVCAKGCVRLGALAEPILQVTCGTVINPAVVPATDRRETEWVLLTSGTSGAPKMVVHTLATVTGAIKPDPHRKPDMVWGTFYDIRRYGGLQI